MTGKPNAVLRSDLPAGPAPKELRRRLHREGLRELRRCGLWERARGISLRFSNDKWTEMQKILFKRIFFLYTHKGIWTLNPVKPFENR